MTKKIVNPHDSVRVRTNAARGLRLVAARIEKAGRMPSDRGLCHEVDEIVDRHMLSHKAESVIKDLISSHVKMKNRSTSAERRSTYAYYPGEEWEARCFAALWMAHEIEENVDLPVDTQYYSVY